jgi:hypothetical protein
MAKRERRTKAKIERAEVPPGKDELRLPDSVVAGLAVSFFAIGRGIFVCYRQRDA